jgi:hypothetical protein
MMKVVNTHSLNDVPKIGRQYLAGSPLDKVEEHFTDKYGYAPLSIVCFSTEQGNWQFICAEAKSESTEI